MNELRSYSIAYKGVSDGSHHYDFKVDDSFFRSFEGTDIKGGNLDVEVELTKRGSLIVLAIAITGEVSVECDRCLDDFPLWVEYDGELNVRTAEGDDTQEDESLMWLSAAEDSIPLAKYIYESIYLSLPYQRTHPDNEDDSPGCDPDMLSRFDIVTEEEFEEIVGKITHEINPQWAKLEQLKEKLEDKE